MSEQDRNEAELLEWSAITSENVTHAAKSLQAVRSRVTFRSIVAIIRGVISIFVLLF